MFASYHHHYHQRCPHRRRQDFFPQELRGLRSISSATRYEAEVT